MSDGPGKRAADKPVSQGQLDNAIDSDQHSGRASWDKRSQKTLAGLDVSDELDARDLSPDELRRLRRRISNRESARRLRKQRNEKLHTLVAQQDSLQAENEALNISITAAKTVLQRLNEENEALRAQLGDKAKMPEIAVPKLLNAPSSGNAASQAGSVGAAAPDTAHVLRLPAAPFAAAGTSSNALLARAPVALSVSAVDATAMGIAGGTRADAGAGRSVGPGDGSASPPSNATADTSAVLLDKPRPAGVCTDMPPPPPPAVASSVAAAAVAQRRTERGAGSSGPAKRAKLMPVDAAPLPVHVMAVSTAARQG